MAESVSSKRLFLAISAAPLEEALAPWARKLKIGADRKDLNLRWMAAKDRHITLIFLGERSEADRASLESIVGEVAATVAPLRLKIEDVGAFPEMKSARVIWFGVQNSKRLRGLRDAIADRLREDLGWSIESSYQPHLTIARLRNPKSLVDFLSPFVRARAGKLEVAELVLYESILAGPFPVYRALARFPLTGIAREEGIDEAQSDGAVRAENA